MTTKYSFNNSKILLGSSSVGFRRELGIFEKYLPERLRYNAKGNESFIKYQYNTDYLALYKSGMTLIEFLLYLEKLDNLDSYTHLIVSFGIVESWNRECLNDSGSSFENLFNKQLNTLIENKNSIYSKKYINLLLLHKDKVQNGGIKTLMSKEIWIEILRDFLEFTNCIDKRIMIIFNSTIYKSYTRDSVKKFNNIVYELKEIFDFKIIQVDDVSLFDNVHLNISSHSDIIRLLEAELNFKNINSAIINLIAYFNNLAKYSTINKVIKFERGIIYQIYIKVKSKLLKIFSIKLYKGKI